VDPDYDFAVRLAARVFVDQLMAVGDGTVSWHDLKTFEFQGRRIALIGQTGILKPRGFEAALTIMTTHRTTPGSRPYYDEEGPDGYQRYKWRGQDGEHSDNRALRTAMQEGKPLIWFYGVDRGRYVPVMPVLLLAEEPSDHQFVLGFDGLMKEQWNLSGLTMMAPGDIALRREYAIVTTRVRLHQPIFRQQVLGAYRSQCAICSLRHVELLEAAHIREDSQGGEPIVSNGVSMCVLHHKAFDKDVIGIRPDFTVETRPSVLEEHDGPTLEHAIQGVHGRSLLLPRRKEAHPDGRLLEERYERFRSAS
jgi:putative restriction endonuclease